MFSRLKLSHKIGGGFGIILALTAVVVYIAVDNGKKVKHASLIQKGSANLVGHMKQARIHALYYLWQGKTSHADKTLENLDIVNKEAKKLSLLTSNDLEKADFLELADLAKAYKEGMQEILMSDKEYSGELDEAISSAKVFESNLVQLENENSSMKQAALQLHNRFLNLRGAGKDFIGDPSKDNRDKILALINTFKDQIENFKNQNATQGNSAMIQDSYNAGQKYQLSLQNLTTLTLDRLDRVKEIAGIGALLAEKAEKKGASALTTLNSVLEQGNKLIFASGIIALILGLFLSIIVTVSLLSPIGKIQGLLEKLSEGNLTEKVDINSRDEIGKMGEALNSTISRLGKIILGIRNASEQTAAGSEQLSASAQNISGGAQNQASSVEEIAASIQQLTNSINEVAENAKQASDVATETSSVAEKGSETVNRSLESMERINESSKQISKITDVISQIANQTNLLALNAAIEAASAGEHGMGFAVVADEVRKLAERASQAAEEITQLIEESTNRVVEGTRLSNEVGASLKQILEGIAKTSKQVVTISESSQSQATTATEVNKSVENISAITQENSAGAEEMAASAEEMSAQAQQLQQLVGRFKVEENEEMNFSTIPLKQNRKPQNWQSQNHQRMTGLLTNHYVLRIMPCIMNNAGYYKAISLHDFQKIQRLMLQNAGISLGDKKSQLVENRLRGRLTALGLNDFSDYIQYISDPRNKTEQDRCIESLTTNETFFFRHKSHWDFFNQVFIEESKERKRKNKLTKVWSAASSTGAEAYSASICLYSYLDSSSNPCWVVEGTDINTEVLKKAKQGLFDSYSLQKCTEYCRKNFFTTLEYDKYELRNDLKRQVAFKVHNLFNTKNRNKYNLIFLRNVLIYFNEEQKQIVLENVLSSLLPGGYLLLGGAESLKSSDWNLNLVSPTIYKYG